MNTQEKIIHLVNQIKEMNEQQLIELNNTYCMEFNYLDNEVYENDDYFFETFFDGKVIEAVRACHFGDYNYSDNYVKFNGYGNLESFRYFEVTDLCEFPLTMVEYIVNDNKLDEFSHIFDLTEI